MPRKKKKREGKVKNATKVKIDGITFRSKLEGYCYTKLKEANIKNEYEELTITLIEPFRFNGKYYAGNTYTPDFVGDNFIIECKGFFTDVARIKWKLFLNNYVVKKHPEIKIYMLFYNARQKIYKKSKSTYAEWCEKHGIEWAHRKIKKEWLSPSKP